VALIIVTDLLARTRLEQSARAAGLTPVVRRRLGAADGDPPAIVVLDLDAPDALDDIPDWRQRWPQLPIVGFAAHKDRPRWDAAAGLGVAVVPRGATASAADRIFAGIER
jgi:hypothetical protein